ncbi:hypothetical protein B0A49_11761, partial [Cryomyces minteri]
KAIALALKGKDILGAAKTGSGKTLAFLIPVLENLYRAQCIGADAGLGALIISPTRELAIQIFEVLRKIGRKGHLFSAGLMIGGTNLQEQRDALSRMNILVCTPGRILDHLSKTAAFNVDNLRMLVLDEADRILDMGFQRDVDAIVEYLPKDRQTLLFSATQTKKVSDLARLSLSNPDEEEGMLKRLEHKKVPIERINVKQKKQMSIKNQLQNMCFKDPQLKYLGQKAFVSYVKSIYVQKDKEIFKMSELPLEDFAASLGLPGAPRIKFMKGDDAKALKNAPKHGLSSSDDESEAEDTINGPKGASVLQTKEKNKQDSVRTKYDRMFERRNQDVLADHYAKMIRDDDTQPDGTDRLDGEQAEDDDLFTVKRRIEADQALSDDSGVDSDHQLSENGKHIKKILIPGAKEPLVLDSKRREKLLKSKKKLLKLKDKGTKLVFDDEGNAHPIYEFEGEDQFVAKGAPEEQRRKFLEEESKRVETADLADKEAAREKKRTKREKRKERERLEAEEKDDDGGIAGTEGAEDGFANFLADAQPLSDEDEGEEPKQKRPKKWFENDKHKEQAKTGRQEPETLEDLEALASGLLG